MSFFEIAALAAFLASLAGLVLILARKLPRLASLPKTTPALPSRGKSWLVEHLPLRNFLSEVFLQKILSKTWILTLRLENKTGGWLGALRKKTQEHNGHAKQTDDFWDDLQKNKDQPT